ncbi:ABC transporter substrate-binding protein [Micropruina sonneratiae]|uniref:ABC transporter substrate-binding protein n=1 Tax=Micropruina sonneratiae TaxID=2986940 RepID=UPI002227703E|nr:extracellular solute-binding protein [Micropruina sp. KQZ13P-5]MCW3158225.1 extracellular solute-binding protein [Micropruina sp. KQZ13P-5]
MRAKTLVAVAVAAALSLVGCSSGAPAASQSASESASAAPSGGAGGEVGVFTWWADGSEKVGLDALVKLFGEKYPNDTFVNLAVAGGAGSNAKAKLASELANGNPPDSFQGHAGAELQDYIRADQIEPVNEVIDSLGGSSVFPQSLLDLLTVQGNIYSVPSNIHRANVVWANPAVLKKADITAVPADLDAWLSDMEKLKQAGVSTPLSIAGTWTQVQLFETVLIADLGVDEYTKLFAAGANWESDGVKKAVDHYAKLLSYANTASDGDDWPGATDAVIDGKAAYNVMGDWAVAEFTLKNKTDGEDYTYFPVPGTDGVFDFLADSFTLPKGAKNAAGAKDWLALIGSADGQKAFNLAKGSIPARTDVPATDFPKYQQSAMEAFKTNKIAPSIAHGAAVSQAWNSDISTAISKFYGSKDQATLIADLVAAAQKNAA